jgi:DNA polymerase-3 subunit epsilon
MRELRDFTQGCALVAHNAAFDSGFWRAEVRRAEGAGEVDPVFACTLLLSRRLHPEAPDHRLGTLAQWHGLPRGGRAHRALADAEVTAHLLLRLQRTVCERFARDRAPHGLLVALQRVARTKLARCVEAYGAVVPG